MIKWIGQHIWDFVSRFRNDVYLESLTTTTESNVLVVDSDGKVSKSTSVGGDITSITAGTNCSGGGASGDVTINVDDAFLINSGDDATTGTITAGGFTTTGTWTFDEYSSGTVGITTVQDSGTTFDDNDTSLMTAAAIDDRILSYGYSTTTGTVTSVGTTTGLSGTVTSSGNLSLALGDLADMTQSWVTAEDEFIVLDNGTQKRKLSSEIFGSNAFTSTTIGTTTNNLTFDDTTIQLNTGTTWNGSAARTVSAKTATISDGGTGLATADQIHEFVTTQTDAMDADTAGNAATATLASTSTIVDAEAASTTYYPVLVDGLTGPQALEAESELTFVGNTGILTATGFAGNLTGNVTGNTSGSSGSCTGNAATATEATNITVSANNSSDETVYPIFVDGATGTQGAESDTGLTYNPSTGMLTTTGVTATFTGNITGNVTGNTSGSSGSCTGNAATATALATARGLQVDLTETDSSNFDGSGDVTDIGVTGALAVGNGGTGATSLTDNKLLTGGTTITAEANATYDGNDLSLTSSTDDKPVLSLTNTNTSAGSHASLRFIKDADDVGVGEFLGDILFIGDNDAAGTPEQINYARIWSRVNDETDGSEEGSLYFGVAEYDGTMGTGMYLQGSSTIDGAVNVTIGNSSGSTTSIVGVLEADQIKHEISGAAHGNVGHGAEVVYFGSGTVVAGGIYYYKSDGSWALTNANAEATASGLLGVALDGGTASDVGMCIRGMVCLGTDSTGDVGDVLWLDAASNGVAADAAPTGGSDIARVIGYCLNADGKRIFFNPDNTFVEIA